MDAVCSLYPRSKVPVWVSYIGDDQRMRCRILDEMLNINCDAGPGVPLHSLGLGQNGNVLRSESGLVANVVIERLRRFLAEPPAGLSPRELVEQGYCDPVRLFVKDEPHSIRKRRQGRCRLIMSVSLADQLVERMLFNAQNKLEIKNYANIPSKPGMGFTDLQLRQTWLYVKKLAGDKVSEAAEADVKGFDWSVQEWELMFDARCRVKLAGTTLDSDFGVMVMGRVYALTRAVLTDYHGNMYSCVIPGIQLSGSFNTSSTNSRIRVTMALAVGAKWAVAMGDDCVEQYVENAEAKYAVLGHPLRMYKRCTDSFEFCSTRFTATRCYPTDGTKTLYRLIEQKTITGEFLYQFRSEMRNHPRLREFESVIAKVMLSSSDNECYGKENTQGAETHPQAQECETRTEADGPRGRPSSQLCGGD